MKGRLGKVLAAALAAAAAASCASAMEFTVVVADTGGVRLGLDPVIILGEGDVVEGDADRLRSLMAQTGDGDPLGRAQSPELHLNSPGGDSWEGIALGRAIRDLRLVTFVPEGAICASACTTAFLGGVERGVAGEYRIHAAARDFTDANPTTEELNKFQEQLQILTVAYTSFARDMIGDTTVAEEALYYGLGCKATEQGTDYVTGCAERGAATVPDDLLRDWNVITFAARPEQRVDDAGLTTTTCTAPDASVPEAVWRNFCVSLPLMRLDLRMGAAMRALSQRPQWPEIEAEQARWVTVRDRCELRLNNFAKPSKDIGTELLGAMIGIDPEQAQKDAEAANSGAVPMVGTGGVQWTDAQPAKGDSDAAAALLDHSGRPVPGSDILKDALAQVDDLQNEALYATGDLGVRYCLRDVYERRVRQLEGLRAYYGDRRSYQGESWAE
jgi:hypothetical protein